MLDLCMYLCCQYHYALILLLMVYEPMGVILVFLTGQDDIDTAQLITEEAQNNGKSSLVLIVLPLYSGLTRADQGIVYVVDSGFSKQRFYNLVIFHFFSHAMLFIDTRVSQYI
ncbi:putative RNA helicase [Helianthus debilis subsp. tardiflorus]